MPELMLDPAPPAAVVRSPLPTGAKISWILRAVYPAPQGAVWVRYWETDSKECLEILTAAGTLLQRTEPDPSLNTEPPIECRALYLEPARQHGPLLYLRSSRWHHFYAFPDGFAGFLSDSSAPLSQYSAVRFGQDRRGITELLLGKERRHWTGVSFLTGTPRPDIAEGMAPRRLPLSPTREETRFAAVTFERVYFLRWVTRGERASLEVLDKTGRRLAHHALKDNFGASPRFTFLSADWADERRKRQPVVIVRDSDQVRVHVFADGLRKLLAAQDFNDSSSSISATTVSFGRDKKGMLTVTESYSERGSEDGSGGSSSENNYRWTGSRFE